ncbi:MAG: DUF3105 domain-containing protein [Alphaproteobacteria bacterium]
MSKSRGKRRRRRATQGGKQGAAVRRAPLLPRPQVLAALAVVALVAASAWWWYAGRQAEAIFLAHARRGEAALSAVVRPPNEGRGHLEPGQSVAYRSDPPTSGVHDPDWIRPGVYDSVQRRTKLVHALEHGLIVIYYDAPDAAAWNALTAWADLFDAPWSGIVLAPKPGLGEELILTAWNRVFRLERFDADAAAAFIDAYRGRGPEHPVR